MHAESTTPPARLADRDWPLFCVEAEALAVELEALGHAPSYAGRFAAELVDDLLGFAAAWDAQAAEQRGAALDLADLLARAERGELADDLAPVLLAAADPAPERTPAHERAAAKASYHLAAGLVIRYAPDGAALVPSGTRGGTVHRVEDGRCSCEAAANGRPCWHVEAVAQVEAGAVAPLAA
jgi:hypothetical protein